MLPRCCQTDAFANFRSTSTLPALIPAERDSFPRTRNWRKPMQMSWPSLLIVVSVVDTAASRVRLRQATCHECKTTTILRRLLLAQRAIGGNGFIELLQALFSICSS